MRHFRNDQPSNIHALVEWVIIVVVAVSAALLIRTFVVQTFYIPSASMEPTLEINDRVLVNKLEYRFSDVERGDVLVFERPPNDPDTTVEDLIKRVIGLPGDTIEARDGQVFINGDPIDEPYLVTNTPTTELPPTQVEEGTLFMLGDNRTDSYDSRRLGAVDEELVVGKANLLIWPLDRVGTL